jgi:hypothetical protein
MKSDAVYTESFASKVAGIKKIGSLAARAIAPELMNIKDKYAANIKKVTRAFNEPKAALKDLFEGDPDIFRNCKLKDLIKDSAAGVAAGTAGDSYKGSYKAIFTGSVKKGNEANSPLENSNNFSVTIKPTERRGADGIKYVADRIVFKDDVEFTNVSSSAIDKNAEYINLFKTSTNLKDKFILKTPYFFNPQGFIDRRDVSKGFRLNFDGKVTFPGKVRDVLDDEYIIVIDNRGTLSSKGELFKGNPGVLMNSSVNINYSQKDILIESKKLVDLFCK